MAVYFGLSTSRFQGFVGVDIPCKDFHKCRRFQAIAINSHFITLNLDVEMTVQLIQLCKGTLSAKTLSAKKASFIGSALYPSSLSFFSPPFPQHLYAPATQAT